MAVAAFKLPSPVVESNEKEKGNWRPIDTSVLPTKELTELWSQHKQIMEADAKVRAEIEKHLLPFLPEAPDGMITAFGWRFGGVAFDHVLPRERKGKMVLTAPIKKGK